MRFAAQAGALLLLGTLTARVNALRAQTPPASSPPASPADVATIQAIVRASCEVISGPAGTPRQWRRDSTLYAPGATFTALGERDGKPRAVSMTPEDYRRATNDGFVARGLFEYEIGSRIEQYVTSLLFGR